MGGHRVVQEAVRAWLCSASAGISSSHSVTAQDLDSHTGTGEGGSRTRDADGLKLAV